MTSRVLTVLSIAASASLAAAQTQPAPFYTDYNRDGLRQGPCNNQQQNASGSRGWTFWSDAPFGSQYMVPWCIPNGIFIDGGEGCTYGVVRVSGELGIIPFFQCGIGGFPSPGIGAPNDVLPVSSTHPGSNAGRRGYAAWHVPRPLRIQTARLVYGRGDTGGDGVRIGLTMNGHGLDGFVVDTAPHHPPNQVAADWPEFPRIVCPGDVAIMTVDCKADYISDKTRAMLAFSGHELVYEFFRRPLAGVSSSVSPLRSRRPCTPTTTFPGLASSSGSRTANPWPPAPHIIGFGTPRLDFTAVQPTDGGIYQFVLTPACGGTPITTAPATYLINGIDFNEDGVRSVEDLFGFLEYYFRGCVRNPFPPCNGRSADTNGDMMLSVQDIFDFLAGFFAP